MFPEFGVIDKNNYNINLKKLLGFRNMQEKLENYFICHSPENSITLFS